MTPTFAHMAISPLDYHVGFKGPGAGMISEP